VVFDLAEEGSPMPKFAANLSFMFQEWSFLDRFDAAAAEGFAAVEFLSPFDCPAEKIAAKLAHNRLQLALFNVAVGDFANGERGIAALPGRFDEIKADVERALVYAEATGVRRFHLMAGLADPSDAAAANSFRRAGLYAAERFAEKGIDLLLEPINGRDIPGYFLNDFPAAVRLIEDWGQANVKLQFDIYHRQILHGDVTTSFRALLPLIGHVQIASVPSRHEPDTEELNYPFLFEEMDRLGYAGFVGCEYRPRAGTREGLGWFASYRRNPG
jgi:2-dehydrotetronate isomerase